MPNEPVGPIGGKIKIEPKYIVSKQLSTNDLLKAQWFLRKTNPRHDIVGLMSAEKCSVVITAKDAWFPLVLHSLQYG